MNKMKMVPIGAIKQVCLIGRTGVWLSLRVGCLLFCLGWRCLPFRRKLKPTPM